MIQSSYLYNETAEKEMKLWQQKMSKKPTFFSRVSKKMQNRVNRIIPEKVHEVITAAIKETVKGMMTGAGLITPKPLIDVSLEEREQKVRERINFYKNTAAAEGAITGAGGILLGLADFPLWLSIKMKLLLEIAAIYGYDVKDTKERMFILTIFQLSFSSQQHRNKIYGKVDKWTSRGELPEELNQLDWRSFQQEYRDYIDIAKLLQLVPGIGAVVGAYVNHRLTDKLGTTAINAYRMRYFRLADDRS
jgi:uncharacterized protein (DUF697 family)